MARIVETKTRRGANRQNGGPADPYITDLIMQDDDVVAFSVSTDGRNGTLTVEVMDCCIAGDQWGIRIIDKNGVTEACGNGSTTSFSGTTVERNLVNKDAAVEVFLCESNLVSSSQTMVRFQWSEPDFSVEQLP